MRQASSPFPRTRNRRSVVTFLAGLALACLMAVPAQAGNEFDDGFEDQLGRLVATEVFHLGRFLLTGGAHYAYTYDDRHARRAHRRAHRHHRQHRHDRHHHHDHDRHHWREHEGHAHRYGDPCNEVTHERVRRNRYGEVVEYERHEVRYRDRWRERW